MSDTNRVGLRFREEAIGTPGTATSGAYEALPFTGSSDLGFTPETTASNIIRSDRQVSDLVLVNGTVGGGFDTELVRGNALDRMLEGVMFTESGSAFSDQSATTHSSVSLTITDGSGETTVAGTGIDTGAVVGNFCVVETASGDITGVVRAASTGSLTLIASTDISGAITGDVTHLPTIVNGVQERSYTFERTFRTGESGSEFYEYLYGMRVGSFSMSAAASSIVEASFGFLGQSQEYRTNAQGRIAAVTSTPAAPTFSVYNAASNVATISIGGEPVGDNFVMEASIEVENNLRERNALGTLGAISIGAGEFNVTGSLSTYFNDSALLQTVLDNSETSLTLGFTTPDGDAIAIFLPRVKFSEGTPDVSGKNADVMANISFQAIKGSEAGIQYTMAIGKKTA